MFITDYAQIGFLFLFNKINLMLNGIVGVELFSQVPEHL